MVLTQESRHNDMLHQHTHPLSLSLSLALSLSLSLFFLNHVRLFCCALHPALLLGAIPSNTSDLICLRGRREHCVTATKKEEEKKKTERSADLLNGSLLKQNKNNFKSF